MEEFNIVLNRRYNSKQIDSKFNLEPVYFCRYCNSLHIRGNSCLDCYSADIGEINIFDWLKLTRKKTFKNGKELRELGEVALGVEIEVMFDNYYQ